MDTVLITGCSSGFGLETARYFQERGWRVIATMRDPQPDLLPSGVTVMKLDVTSTDSIAALLAEVGEVDVLVNNAGIGWLNAFEGTPISVVRNIFETNTFGTMALIQAFLPAFRERGKGVIINVTSSVTLMPLNLLAVYTASKAAVNAFTDCVALELAPFGIRTHVVLPGRAPGTRFGDNAREMIFAAGGFHPAYGDQVQQVMGQFAEPTALITTAEEVAAAIWMAATDDNAPARIPAGQDAVALFKG